jgi:pyruvate dehydrogenase E1 component alpha subunit
MFRDALIADGIASTEEMAALDAEIEQEVEDCAQFAIDSPDPDPAVAFQHLFTDAYDLEDIL